MVDLWNHSNLKLVPVLVIYFAPTRGIQVKIIEFQNLTGETSEILVNHILSYRRRGRGSLQPLKRLDWPQGKTDSCWEGGAAETPVKPRASVRRASTASARGNPGRARTLPSIYQSHRAAKAARDDDLSDVTLRPAEQDITQCLRACSGSKFWPRRN